jgi:spore germination cell wall hydrolase CwlJ-like protein
MTADRTTTERIARREPISLADLHWPEVNWTARSLLAATGVAVCLMMTAMSATASVKRSATARAAADAVADEADLVADLASYLAAETADARAALDAPDLRPAMAVGERVAGGAPIDDLVNFDFTKVEQARLMADERRCLAQAIYYEAGGESRVGQMAVADVVLNRVASPLYPDTVCGVVFQGSHRRTGCQFSFTCDGSMKRRMNQRRWANADALAGAVLAGVRMPVSRNATHYHADYVSPGWAAEMAPTATIGAHRFYKFAPRSTFAAATQG